MSVSAGTRIFHSTVLLAFLALARDRAVTRDELAEVLWAQHLPAHWAGALRGVLSQIRAALVG